MDPAPRTLSRWSHAVSRILDICLLGHSSVDEDFTYAFGLYRLQAYLEVARQVPHSVVVFDRKVTDDEDEDFALLVQASPQVVGLSAYLWNLPRLVRLVARLRSWQPGLLIVMGGPSAAGFVDLAPDSLRPDLVVIGPGEVTFANIVDAHACDQLDARVSQLGTVISHRGATAVRYDAAQPMESLDPLPSPYLAGLVQVDTTTLYVETDRGCPYSCAFCVESTAPARVTQFSMERIEQELRWAVEHGFSHVEMCSAIFNRDTAWLEAFVELMARVDPERTLSLSAALYSTYVDEHQAQLLGRLNLKSALFGLNSTNEDTFRSVRRVIRRERFAKRIALLGRYLRPEVSLIMGLPGDTPQGFAQTLEFATSLDVDVMIFRFMVLPNTLYYDQRERHGLEIDFADGNRILSTNSYTREDLSTMESMARDAGFVPGSAGQWSRRRDVGFAGPTMDRRTWNFLYLALQALDLAAMSWPDGWRFSRVRLEVRRFVQIELSHQSGERLEAIVSARVDDAPRFSHSRLFNLAYRRPHQPGRTAAALDEAAVGAVMQRLSSGVVASERELLESGRPPPATTA